MSGKKIRSAAWNIEKGGFSTYDSTEPEPPRQERIARVVQRLGADALTLPDVFRWDSHYGGDEGIATFLDMESAFYTPLGDARLKRTYARGDEIGVVFATNQPVAVSETLDIGARQANRTVLDIGKYGVQFASLYLDDLNEDTRTQQLCAAITQLGKEDIPTVLQGDFNALRPLQMARLSEKARSALIRLATQAFPARSNMATTLKELERRQALSVPLAAGFSDGDPKQRPTALGRARVFGVDYIMSRGDGVSVSGVTTLSPRGGSDHRVVVGNVTVK